MTAATKPVWQGAPSLKRLLVPLADLHRHPRNYRRGDVAVIAGSLATFGQLKPIVVQAGSNVIVAGNHTADGCEANEWTHVAVVMVDMDDRTAERYLVADNRTSDLATNDLEAEAAILAELADAGMLEGTGWTPDETDDLLSELDAVAQAAVEPAPGLPGESDDAHGKRRTHERTSSPVPLFDVVLSCTESERDQLHPDVRALMRSYGTDNVKETILRAVHERAQELAGADDNPA